MENDKISYFRDYDHISLSIFFSKHFFRSMASFHYIYTVPKYNLVSPYMLLACIFPGLTIWTWTANCCAFTWDDHSSHAHSQLCFVVCGSLCRADASWTFPSPSSHLRWCQTCSAHVWAVIFLSYFSYPATLLYPLNSAFPGIADLHLDIYCLG